MDPYRQLLTDIRLGLRQAALRPVYTVEENATPTGRGVVHDFATIAGLDNLGQAVMLRLLTPRGELGALAHPEYGSRLHELIGRPNTENTRNLARLFILEALAQERRIAKVKSVTVTPTPGTRDRLDVTIQAQPIGGGATLDLGPFTLAL